MAPENSLSVSLRKVKIRSANFQLEPAHKADIMENSNLNGLLNTGKRRGDGCSVFGNYHHCKKEIRQLFGQSVHFETKLQAGGRKNKEFHDILSFANSES